MESSKINGLRGNGYSSRGHVYLLDGSQWQRPLADQPLACVVGCARSLSRRRPLVAARLPNSAPARGQRTGGHVRLLTCARPERPCDSGVCLCEFKWRWWFACSLARSHARIHNTNSLVFVCVSLSLSLLMQQVSCSKHAPIGSRLEPAASTQQAALVSFTVLS